MAKVRSFSLRGKTVNVPHSEHRDFSGDDNREKNIVTFDGDGFAEVSDVMGAALLEHYPSDVEGIKAKAASKS
jgi:hypothetical protein